MAASKGSIFILMPDEELRELLQGVLVTHGFSVQGAVRAETLPAPLDLIILDDAVSGPRWQDWVKNFRSQANNAQTPILGIFSETSDETLRLALELGVNDFVLKPFERGPLISRVQALLRLFRPDQLVQPDEITLGRVVLNKKTQDVFCGSERVELTPSEYKLLEGLMSHSGSILSRDQLMAMVQGAGIAVVDRAIDTHVFSLRKKLGLCSELIETVRGVGYRLKAL